MGKTNKGKAKVVLIKAFEVSSVARADIVSVLVDELGYSKKEAETIALKIDDKTMRHLAMKLGEAFCDTGVFWEGIKCYLQYRKNIKIKGDEI